jgi:hypothetical protein
VWFTFCFDHFRNENDELESDRIFFGSVGDFVVVTAKASYFSGGALSDSEVNWKITQQVTEYV